MGSNDVHNAPVELGGYRLVELLGRGGMGEVWRAEREGPGGIRRRAAVKRILPAMQSNQTLRDRFLAEARINARLENPNIVQVLDFGDRPEPFLVLEFVEGITAADLLRDLVNTKQRLPVVAAAFIAAEAAAGLDYAHRKRDEDGRPLNIVHRDVSPQNILISLDGAVKISDFGVARADDNHFRTQHGMQIGKIGYMPPEQMNGQAIDARADVFSLGVTLWELLTVQPMLPRDDTRAALDMLFHRGIQTPSQIDARLPASVDAVVMPSLAIDPTQRYASAGAFAQALRSFVHSLAPGFDSNQLVRILAKLMPAMRFHVPTNTLHGSATKPANPLSSSSPDLPPPTYSPAAAAVPSARAQMPAMAMPIAGQSTPQSSSQSPRLSPAPRAPMFPAQPEQSLAPLPKSSPLPVIIGIGAVLVIGGSVLAYSLTRGSSPPGEPSVPSAPHTPNTAADAAPPNATNAPQPNTPLLPAVPPVVPSPPIVPMPQVAPAVVDAGTTPTRVSPPSNTNANTSANNNGAASANAGPGVARTPRSHGDDPVRAITRQVQGELAPLRPLVRACLGVPEGSGARVTLGVHYDPQSASVQGIDITADNVAAGPSERGCIDQTVRGAVRVAAPGGGPLVVWYVYEY